MIDEKVYLETEQYAIKHNELSEWRHSYSKNMCVKRIFDKYAEKSYSRCYLKELMQYLVFQYGLERTLYVLARAVQLRESEIELSPKVRDRASKFYYYEDITFDYAVGSEVCALNEAYEILIKIEENQLNKRGEQKNNEPKNYCLMGELGSGENYNRFEPFIETCREEEKCFNY